MEDRADIRERLAGARPRGHDEVLAGGAELDRLKLVAVERVALEDVGDGPVEHASLDDLRNASSHLVGRVELKQRLWPELSFRKRRVNRLADRRVGDVDEAADVARVVADDLGVGVEDVHAEALEAGYQHRKLLNLKAKSRWYHFRSGKKSRLRSRKEKPAMAQSTSIVRGSLCWAAPTASGRQPA